MKKTILFVDNDVNFLDVHSKLLEQAGYHILRATSVQEAEEKLQMRYIHLAIIDIRMEAENDARDISGLELVEKEAYRSIPKIILTAYPSWEYAEKALGAALDGLQLAGMIDKAGGPEVVIQTVERAFAQHVRVNWNLVIRWSERESLSLPHLVTLLEPEVSNERLPHRVTELDDLLRRLFYDSAQININHLFAQRGRSIALAVFAYSKGEAQKEYVVTYGQKRNIVDENTLYEEHVPKVAGPGSIVKDKSAETLNLSATAYTLAGGDLHEITTFSESYRSNSVEIVETQLKHLFGTTLRPWYEKGRFQEEEKTLNAFFLDWLELSEEILPLADLETRVDTVCREALSIGLAQLDYSPYKLTFHRPDCDSVSFPNPISFLVDRRIIFSSPILCGTTHGQLNGNSILTDHRGQTWLINFSQVSRGPLARDFVSLETSIKFDMLITPDVQVRYDLERRLLAVSRLDEEPDIQGLEAEMYKALQAISRIRNEASSIMGHRMNDYLGGLLFCAIGRLAGYDPEVQHTRYEVVTYLHILLSAAMLYQKLIPSPPQEDLHPQAIHSR